MSISSTGMSLAETPITVSRTLGTFLCHIKDLKMSYKSLENVYKILDILMI